MTVAARVKRSEPAPATGESGPIQRARESRARPTQLVAALRQCRKAADRGYAIAEENLSETGKAIKQASRSVSSCLERIETGTVRTPGVVDHLKSQLDGAVSGLRALHKAEGKALEQRRKRLGKFSVTLFGRTMAGKSTLMEVLTGGDGASIGQGAQRTTRNVRSYLWNGLEVTDVPGVAAFEGMEDEEAAFAAAAQADLILFLITDDAPQPVEAECLAKVRALGKPLIGICNVKAAIDDAEDRLIFLRRTDRVFDPTRLDQLVEQFHAFSGQHLPGRRVPFLRVHLRSRFLADQPGFASERDALLAASRFEQVERRIVQEVVGRGAFLRVKSFVDGATAPMKSLSDQLLDFSAENAALGRVMLQKRRQLDDWAKRFQERGHQRIQTLASKLAECLRREVPQFAEDNYESSEAGARWKRLVDSMGVSGKAGKLQQKLVGECHEALAEVARELKTELSLSTRLSVNASIPAERIFDSKRVWNWGTTLVSGTIGVAALFLASTPLGWAAAAVAVAGWLVSLALDDRETKATAARGKLAIRLNQDIARIEASLRKNLGDWFERELIIRQVQTLLGDIGAMTSGLFELANAQRALAWALNDRQKTLARVLLDEALVQLGAAKEADAVIDVARVPGLAMMLVISPGTTFPKDIHQRLERLLDEHVWFVVDNRNPMSMLAQAIGRDCDRTAISIEHKIRVAHVSVGKLTGMARARVALAQQITGFHVMS